MLLGAHMEMFNAADELRSQARPSRSIPARIVPALLVLAFTGAMLTFAGMGMAGAAALAATIFHNIRICPV